MFPYYHSPFLSLYPSSSLHLPLPFSLPFHFPFFHVLEDEVPVLHHVAHHGGRTAHLLDIVRQSSGRGAKDRVPVGSDHDGIAPDVVRVLEPNVLEPRLFAGGGEARFKGKKLRKEGDQQAEARGRREHAAAEKKDLHTNRGSITYLFLSAAADAIGLAEFFDGGASGDQLLGGQDGLDALEVLRETHVRHDGKRNRRIGAGHGIIIRDTHTNANSDWAQSGTQIGQCKLECNSGRHAAPSPHCLMMKHIGSSHKAQHDQLLA